MTSLTENFNYFINSRAKRWLEMTSQDPYASRVPGLGSLEQFTAIIEDLFKPISRLIPDISFVEMELTGKFGSP